MVLLFILNIKRKIQKKEFDMATEIPRSDTNSTKVQVELPSNILTQLLKSGLLHGGDCKCLNASAKQVLWQALSATSADVETHSENYLCA